MLRKMRKPREQETDLETVDTCTKLLDLEVSNKRKRRNSMPFLPSRYASVDNLYRLKMDLNKKPAESPSGDPKFKWEFPPILNFLRKATSTSDFSKEALIEPQSSKKNLEQGSKNNRPMRIKGCSKDQNDEFYKTWKRIQGSRMRLTDDER